jgi:hypothetical protein
MRMGLAGLLAAGWLLAAPAAYAQEPPNAPPYTLTIAVTPERVLPGQTVRVTAPSPPANVVQYYGGAAGFSYDVILSFTTAAGTQDTVARRGLAGTAIDTTLTVPVTAKSGTVATVAAYLGYDSPGAYAAVGTDTAPLAIGPPPVAPGPPVRPVAATGALTLSRVRVPAGGTFTVSGTACRASRYAVRYRRTSSSGWTVVARGTPDAAGTFRARVAAASLRQGSGYVSAVCGTTAYPTLRVRVLAAAPLLPRTGSPIGALASGGIALVAAGVACQAAGMGRGTARSRVEAVRSSLVTVEQACA